MQDGLAHVAQYYYYTCCICRATVPSAKPGIRNAGGAHLAPKDLRAVACGRDPSPRSVIPRSAPAMRVPVGMQTRRSQPQHKLTSWCCGIVATLIVSSLCICIISGYVQVRSKPLSHLGTC